MRIEEKNGSLVIVDLNDLEVYKIACKVEKDGIYFYSKLLDLAVNEKSREILNLLLEEEKKHLQIFEDIMFNIRKEEWIEKEDDLLDDLDYGVFPVDMPELEAGIYLKDPQKAVALCILMEKRTVAFYDALRDKIMNEKTKKEIENIKKKEEEHIVILQNLLKDIKENRIAN